MTGHGKSEPKEEKLRCYIPDFEDIIDDTLARIDSVRPQHPGLPLFMAGTSMGGLCATHVVLRKQADFAGLILCSAAIDVEWTPVLRWAVQQPGAHCRWCYQNTNVSNGKTDQKRYQKRYDDYRCKHGA
eukprot:363141-Chlamydomonas_euryale.AAC.7